MKHASPAQRAEWVQRFYQSGLTQLEFARRHGLVHSTLKRWLARHQLGTLTPSLPGFTEVKLPSSSSRWAAEVAHPDGTVVRLAHDVPAHLLQELLAPC